MPERFASPTRVRRPKRVGVLVLATLALALAARTTRTSLAWVDRPFPGFLLLKDRVIAAIGLPGWSSATAPGLYLSQVTRADGRPVSDERAVYAIAAEKPVGTPVTYRVRRGDVERDVVLATGRFTARDWILLFGAYLVNAVVLLVAGLLVWALTPTTPLVAAFLAFSLAFATFLLTAMDVYAPATFLHLYLVSNTLLFATALQLALLFPEPHRLARLRFAGYPIALAVTVVYEVYLRRPEVTTTAFAVNTALTGAVGLFFGGRLIAALRGSGSALVRQRVRVVALGTLLGLSVPGVILLLSVVFRSAVAENAALFAVPVFPAVLAYAIAKHDFFAIDAMVKRGATYLAVSGAVVVGYVVAALLLNVVLQQGTVTSSPLFALVFTLGVLFVVVPLRDRVQALVDRVFFRTRYDGTAVLADLAVRLAGARHRQAIVGFVQDAVQRTIASTTVAVLAGLAASDPGDAALRAELAAERVATIFDPPEACVDPARCEPARRALARRGVEIAVPMLRDGALVGVLALGPKRSGLFYTAGDAEFLRALAQAAAIALDNAAAYEALETLNAELETRVRDRTAALTRAYDDLKRAEVQLVQSEKLASLGRLAAGVAHEINNPVSFIVSNVPPLQARLEQLARTVPPAERDTLADARELVDVMGRGAERTAAIVRDLRAFSRVGEAPRKAIDLHEAIDVAVRLLEPRWRGRITIDRRYGALPAVTCDPGQINQVFMNLLANACDAVAQRGSIRIDTAASDGRVTVAIGDDGCGIPADRIPHVFEPFFTTKDVGAGTGLGLAIVHGIVTAHGGEVGIESTVGAGTTVRVVLPVASA